VTSLGPFGRSLAEGVGTAPGSPDAAKSEQGRAVFSAASFGGGRVLACHQFLPSVTTKGLPSHRAAQYSASFFLEHVFHAERHDFREADAFLLRCW